MIRQLPYTGITHCKKSYFNWPSLTGEEKILFCLNYSKLYSKKAFQGKAGMLLSFHAFHYFFYYFTQTHYQKSSGQREANRNVSKQRQPQPKTIWKKGNIYSYKM